MCAILEVEQTMLVLLKVKVDQTVLGFLKDDQAMWVLLMVERTALVFLKVEQIGLVLLKVEWKTSVLLKAAHWASKMRGSEMAGLHRVEMKVRMKDALKHLALHLVSSMESCSSDHWDCWTMMD